jgi:hypothetical protein
MIDARNGKKTIADRMTRNWTSITALSTMLPKKNKTWPTFQKKTVNRLSNNSEFGQLK